VARTIARVGWKVVLTIYAILNIAGLPDNAQDLRAFVLPLGPHVGRIVGIAILVGIVLSLVPVKSRRWLWSRRPGKRGALPAAERAEPSQTVPGGIKVGEPTHVRTIHRPGSRVVHSSGARENPSRRRMSPSVPDPPTLPAEHPARDELARHLRILVTEGDELASDPDIAQEEQAKARAERKEWARRAKRTLDDAGLESHGAYVFSTTEQVVPSGGFLVGLARAARTRSRGVAGLSRIPSR